MIIKAYLYSNRTRQLNHKYYSLSTDRDTRLFHDLKQDTAYFERLENKAFVYEVEVESEDIIECQYSYLRATAFRIKSRVDFRTVANEMSIVTQTRNKINSILNGNIEKEELFALYKKYMEERPTSLTHSEQMKFLAILNQTKYELPCLQPFYFVQIRLLEDCKIPYSLPESYKSSDWTREVLLGSSYFENYKLSIKKFKSVSEISLLIQTRKLTQSQFNQLCNYIKTEEVSVLLGVISNSIKAGYEILPEYRELFYPYILYHAPTKNLDLITNDYKRDEAATALFYCGYKFKNYDYNNMDNYYKAVVEAKTIFSNEFKYIE